MRWNVEAEALTHHIFYEMKSVADMIDQWGISPRAGGELEYALKCRDRFLSHSQLGAFLRGHVRLRAFHSVAVLHAATSPDFRYGDRSRGRSI